MNVQETVSSPVPAVSKVMRTSFGGSSARFLRLLVRGSLLQIPTVGFYRFWLITDIRRYLWSNTRLGQDAFEYTGTAKELLIGFLIALAILTPLYLVNLGLGIEAERLQVFASVPLAAIFYVLAQYGFYRARQYRATRTVFRGVRFAVTGSGWAYAGRAFFWDMLSLLTLGLAYPWRTAALERYRMRHTSFGDLPGRFEGSGWILFKKGIWLWLVAMLVAFGLPFALAMSGQQPGIFTAVLMLVVIGLAFPILMAIQLKWRLQGIRFGAITVTTTLFKRDIVWCYLFAAFVAFAYALSAGLLFGLIVVLSGISFESVAQPAAGRTWGVIAFTIVAVPAYLVFLLGFGVIKRFFVDYGVWAAVAASIGITNAAVLDDVVARGQVADSVGEGIADALDFGF